MMLKKFCVPLFFFSLITASVFSENIRGPVAGIIDIDGADEVSVTGTLESLVGIRIAGELSPLIQGVKLTISGESRLSLYRNSFALYLYHGLDNVPAQELMSYRGTQTYMRFLDFENSTSFLIPLSPEHTLSPDRSSFIVSEENKKEDFPLLTTILPISKGIPDSAYNEEIVYTVSPVFFNKGALRLNILDNQGQPVEENLYVQVDGKRIQDLSVPHIFDTGLHTLVIRSETGVEETLQFSLSPGENLILDHILQLQYPTLKIDTIQGMSVFLNGKPLEEPDLAQSFEIEPGPHLILFQFGDYQFSREFNAEMQSSYRITLIPEIILEKQ